MARMPRPRKPYIQKEVTRHKKIVWYFRRGKEKRIRLPGVFGSPEFNEAYENALAGKQIERKTNAPRSTFRWLVNEYYESGRFKRLAIGTQNNQRQVIEKICDTARDLNFRASTANDIKAGIVRREGNLYAAKAYLNCMKAVFRYALERGLIENDPTEGLSVTLPKSEGHHTWTMSEVDQFASHYPLGSQARLAFDIMLYTGLRISDAIRLGPQHIKDGRINIKAQKTQTELSIPVLAPLAKSISAANISSLLFLTNRKGKAWDRQNASAWFAKQCADANVKGTAHGLRKAGATLAAENGATPHELAAMYGWASTKMAEVYTKKADKQRLAERAANKLFPHQ